MCSSAFAILLFSCCALFCLQAANSTTFTENSGTIKPELKNGQYLNNADEVYYIKIQKGKRLKMSFKAFDVKGAMPNCTQDSLEIFVGCSNKSVGKFCSSVKPFDIYSMDECMKLVFKTNQDGTSKGFEAVYSSLDKKSASSNGTCSKQHDGNFFTPRWPNRYPSNITCVWKFNIPSGYQSQVYFMNFRIEDNFRCNQASVADDYVRITGFNGSVSTTIKQRLCSHYADTTFSVPIHGQYSMVEVKFFADVDIVTEHETGFAAGFILYPAVPDDKENPTGENPTKNNPKGGSNGVSSSISNIMVVLCFLFFIALNCHNM